MATTNGNTEASTEPSTALAADGTASTSVKRKFTDLRLEIVTIDQHYDLTLIVGKPDHVDGQKAFQINRGPMRRVSDVWCNTLEGNWAERKKPNIELPEDSCRAVELVLRVAHWEFHMLPFSLTVQEVAELAVLTDKYNLKTVIGIALKLTEWLLSHKSKWTDWSPTADLQDFALTTSLLTAEEDYEFVVSRLAVEIEMDMKDSHYYYAGSGTDWVKLRSSLPDSILSKSITQAFARRGAANNSSTDRVSDTRDATLRGFIDCCQKSIDECLNDIDQAKAPCSKDLCSAPRLGIMIKDLHRIKLYPVPADTVDMMSSVLDYWKGIKNLGSAYRPYYPCDRIEKGRREHWGTCTFAKCLAGFGIEKFAEELLKQHLHKDVVRHMQSLGPLISPFLL